MTNPLQRPSAFADRLRVARLTAGLTQQQAVERTGSYRREKWCKMENGTYDLGIRYIRAHEKAEALRIRLEAVAKAVNLTVEDLIGKNPIPS